MASEKNKKVGFGAAIAVIAAALVAAAVLVVLLLPNQWQESPEPTVAATQPTRTEPSETQPTETQPTETQPPETQPPVTLPEMSEGSYEQWMAAAGMMASYLAYPQHTDAVAYFLSETPLENKDKSPGIFLELTVNGEKVQLRLLPLEDRRSEAGTWDISSVQTGYATYDEVESIDLTGLKSVTAEELAVYLNEVLLVSLWEN